MLVIVVALIAQRVVGVQRGRGDLAAAPAFLLNALVVLVGLALRLTVLGSEPCFQIVPGWQGFELSPESPARSFRGSGLAWWPVAEAES